MRFSSARAAIVLGGLALVACSALVDFDGLVGAGAIANEGGADATTTIDGATSPSDGGGAVDAIAPLSDAGDAAKPTRCDPTSSFGPPIAFPELETKADDASLRLSSDELTAYFASNRDGDYDIWTTKRASLTSPWSTPVKVGVSGPFNDYAPSLSGDGLSLAFDSDREGGAGNRDLYGALRASTSVDFTSVIAVSALDTSADDYRPFLMPDTLTLYFASGKSGNVDLYRSTRATTSDGFTSSTLVPGIASSAAETFPALTPDELVIYFDSTRAGTGSDDVWRAMRASKSDPFGAPVEVKDLNTTGTDYPTWISDDGCRVYFTSERAGGVGNLDLYMATHTN